MNLYSLVFAQFLEFLTCPWYEGDYYGNVPFVGVVVLLIIVVVVVVAVVVAVVVVIDGWLAIVYKPMVPLVEGPIRELACL